MVGFVSSRSNVLGLFFRSFALKTYRDQEKKAILKQNVTNIAFTTHAFWRKYEGMQSFLKLLYQVA